MKPFNCMPAVMATVVVGVDRDAVFLQVLVGADRDELQRGGLAGKDASL